MEADLEFTKEQDDIKDPKEFDYDYLLVISKFAVPSEKVKGGKASRKERLYFKWEDDPFEKEATVSFEFLTSYKETDDKGVRSFIQGGPTYDGSETQFKLVYLLESSRYHKISKQLKQMVANWTN